jgi:fermentation-respiration switch protein FrsA (DUF1100 family)
MGRATVLAAALTLLTAIGCTSLMSGRPLEDPIVFQPRVYPAGHWIPAQDIEEAWFGSTDGSRLHGWFAEAHRPRAVVLYAHGNAENVSDLRSVLALFRDRLNVSVLVFDYRGYGRSEGTPSEDGAFADARAARRWLATQTNVPEKDIVLVGRSLGGGVAVDLAARDGARGLILESTFSSLPDTAASHFPFLPVRSLMRTRFDSLAKIPNYHGPLLQAHGEADRIVPHELGRKLFDAANEPKWFLSIPGGGHNDPPSREYLAALDRFFDSLPARE